MAQKLHLSKWELQLPLILSLTVHFVGVSLFFIEMPSLLISSLFKDGYLTVEELGILMI